MSWTSPSGRSLADYPRPSVAVDVALLTLDEAGRLAVLLHERADGYQAGRWSLPGTFVHEEERLRDAALRALRTKAGVTGEEPRQLRVFDDPDRDNRGWVLSVAHVDIVPGDRLASGPPFAGRRLARIDGHRAVLPDDQAELPFDHDEIVAAAVRWARGLYVDRPDPRHLLGPEFTLLDLQRVHQAVAGVAELPKDSFRRTMLPHLEATGELRRGVVGKPARVFRRASTPE